MTHTLRFVETDSDFLFVSILILGLANRHSCQVASQLLLSSTALPAGEMLPVPPPNKLLLSKLLRCNTGRRQRVVAWLVDQRSLQQVDRSPHAFHPREHDILMFDRQPAIVAIKTQAITKFPPPFLRVSISQRDIAPSSVLDVLMPNGLQAPGHIQRGTIHICILGVHMMNSFTKGIDCCQRVGTHPKQVTRVQISSDDWSNLLSQLQ